MNDIQKQTPWSVSQIEQTKPATPRTVAQLSGYIANSMNGGHNKVIAWKQVMAGERHREYRLKANFQMLTPLTPAYQNLKMTIRTYFVPNSRVWTNAEKFTAQKGGASESKIQNVPHLGGKEIPIAALGAEFEEIQEEAAILSNTTIWRDAFISSYIPRIGRFKSYDNWTNYQNEQFKVLPPISVLPLRGRIAIYNDFERNKEYDKEWVEYKGDTVSNAEWYSYLPTIPAMQDSYTMRAKREDNYWTNYRTELQGFEQSLATGSSDTALLTWASIESKIAEARAQAENAQKTDWEIIAELRGSKLLSEGKVQLISQKTFPLNYSAITQNTYNNNTQVAEEFRVMGKQGAYSYTEINMPLYAGIEFNEEGYIHIIATVSADSVFESAFDRLELNVNWEDMYRPDMEGDKKDVLYLCESGTNFIKTNGKTEQDIYFQAEGFKRKYSEYFKLPNIIGGDMTSENYLIPTYNYDTWSYSIEWAKQLETQKTYQFFEVGKEKQRVGEEFISKLIWKDYTDLLINKNQAIMNEINTFWNTPDGDDQVLIQGHNQIFFVGVTTCMAELPINSEVIDNYTQWGEH